MELVASYNGPPTIVTWLVVLLGLGLLSFAALGLLLAIVSRKTRPVGLCLLGLTVMLVVGMVGFSTLAWKRAVSMQPRVIIQTRADLPLSSFAASEGFIIQQENGEARVMLVDTDDEQASGEKTAVSKSNFEIKYPDDRPAWVAVQHAREGSVDLLAVSSGPHYTRGQCRLALDDEIRKATAQYVNDHLGARQTETFLSYEVPPSARYDEEVVFSFGPMHQSHALLKFDDGFRRRVERDWKDTIALGRLFKTGFAAAAVLALLATFFAYLRVDTATRGYYTGRLRVGAAAAILGLAGSGAMVAHWLHWI